MHYFSRIWVILITLFVLVFGQPMEQKLTPADGKALDAFGFSISTYGDYVIVGAPGIDENENLGSNNAAYIFKKDGSNWTQEAKLTASVSDTGDAFGIQVSLYTDFAIVGANGDDDNGENAGAAYIFKRDGSNWTQEIKLTANDAQVDDQFGSSVSITSNFAAIGARVGSAGAVYLFEYNGSSWGFHSKLTPSGGFSDSEFGASVALEGTTLAVGATDEGSLHEGAAYIYAYDGTNWVEEIRIMGVDPTGGGDYWLGNSIDISGDFVAIGSHVNESLIYERNSSSWDFNDTLRYLDYDGYEMPVSISGNYAVVGTGSRDFSGKAGSVALFENTGSNWVLLDTLFASDSTAGKLFGWQVDIVSDLTVVGAPADNVNGDFSGSVYIFSDLGITGIEDDFSVSITRFRLGQNFPNPFNPTTTVQYFLPKENVVKLKVYDVLGNEISTLVNEQLPAGEHQIIWDGRDKSGNKVTSGVYFYRLEAEDFVQTRKMLLVR